MPMILLDVVATHLENWKGKEIGQYKSRQEDGGGWGGTEHGPKVETRKDIEVGTQGNREQRHGGPRGGRQGGGMAEWKRNDRAAESRHGKTKRRKAWRWARLKMAGRSSREELEGREEKDGAWPTLVNETRSDKN